MATAQRCLSSMSNGAGTHWTLQRLIIVLWTSLLGIVLSYPIPSRTNNATLMEKRWETLFSRSYLGIAGAKSELNWQSDYLQGIKRVRRLYCNVGIGFHLQVLPDGRISGAHSENQYSELHPAMHCPGLSTPPPPKKKRGVCESYSGSLLCCVIFNQSSRNSTIKNVLPPVPKS